MRTGAVEEKWSPETGLERPVEAVVRHDGTAAVARLRTESQRDSEDSEQRLRTERRRTEGTLLRRRKHSEAVETPGRVRLGMLSTETGASRV